MGEDGSVLHHATLSHYHQPAPNTLPLPLIDAQICTEIFGICEPWTTLDNPFCYYICLPGVTMCPSPSMNHHTSSLTIPSFCPRPVRPRCLACSSSLCCGMGTTPCARWPCAGSPHHWWWSRISRLSVDCAWCGGWVCPVGWPKC